MLTEYLTSIADQLRALLGTSDKINAQNFADKISEVYDAGYAKGVEEGSGSDDVARSIVDGTITEYVDEEIESIGNYAWYNYTSLKNINTPNVKTVGTYAFYNCTALTDVSFLRTMTKMGNYAFYGCTGLTSICLDSLAGVGANGFYKCTGLTDVDLGDANLGSYAFRNCTNLESVKGTTSASISNYSFADCSKLNAVNLPNVWAIYERAFYNCTSLTEIDFPKVTGLNGAYTFANCTMLNEIKMPLVESIRGSTFDGCTSLKNVDFPVVSTIEASSFRNCSSLDTLILRKSDTICTLTSTSAFNNTPIASGTGYIYVPSALIDTYKAATNWSTYADQFRALEDYTVDGTITGELDPDKI